jgi:hypothetical protein
MPEMFHGILLDEFLWRLREILVRVGEKDVGFVPWYCPILPNNPKLNATKL